MDEEVPFLLRNRFSLVKQDYDRLGPHMAHVGIGEDGDHLTVVRDGDQSDHVAWAEVKMVDPPSSSPNLTHIAQLAQLTFSFT